MCECDMNVKSMNLCIFLQVNKRVNWNISVAVLNTRTLEYPEVDFLKPEAHVQRFKEYACVKA